MRAGSCYWRFRTEKVFHYGYPTPVGKGLYRMGLWNGDTLNGPIIDPCDVEVRYK